VAQEPHLNIISDRQGRHYVEVAQGADRITLTPALLPDEAVQALARIRAATGLPVGRGG
jgi:hypothetical protein